METLTRVTTFARTQCAFHSSFRSIMQSTRRITFENDTNFFKGGANAVQINFTIVLSSISKHQISRRNGKFYLC